MSLDEMVNGLSKMLRDEEGGAVVTCALCLEPGAMVDGILVHAFTGKPQCMYRSHL